ncbi:MAG TPA: prephenate dehydrogenase/arogenate dehydrogenase family protein [Deferrisomatales bacterium]|nr:prephenate dehydrogenase/arogenate dehydrogenase family protein [Deferrisomatales bacterium]
MVAVPHPRTLCIVGLGLIGGSLAAALKTRMPHRWQVRGVDRRRESLCFALEKGFLDHACDTLEEGVKGADLVVLAVPVRAIREQLAALAEVVCPGQVVSDTGSTKVGILAEARARLPRGVAFVGGHPVAGSERSGVEGAVAGLFETRSCVLTPADDVPAAALEAVTALWQDAGAEVLCLDAPAHDRVFAFLSHLPHMAAFSLVETAAAGCEAGQGGLAGGALQDFTRVVRSSPTMWRDICLENREPLLQALDRYTDNLRALRARIVAGDPDALHHHFEHCRHLKDKTWKP